MKDLFIRLFFVTGLLFSIQVSSDEIKSTNDSFINESLNDLSDFIYKDLNKIVVEEDVNKIAGSINKKLENNLSKHQNNMIDISTYFLKEPKTNYKDCDFFKISVSLGSIDKSVVRLKKCIKNQCSQEELAVSRSMVNRNYQLLTEDYGNCIIDK